jgi:hypothetical protein
MARKDALTPDAECPRCGMFDGPHGTSEECIRALEAEVQRLTELLKNLAGQLKSEPRRKS